MDFHAWFDLGRRLLRRGQVARLAEDIAGRQRHPFLTEDEIIYLPIVRFVILI